jgi:hypothetical protein
VWSSAHYLRPDHVPIRKSLLGHLWLTPVILATQEAEIRRIAVQSQTCQIVSQDPILEKTHHRKGLLEWLKV